MKQILASPVEGSVGAAIPVEYEREFAEKHNIGKWGRMTMKDGKRVFHAASKTIDDDIGYDHVPMEYTHVGWRYRDGFSLDLNLKKLCSLDEWPVPTKATTPMMLSSIERQLFLKLGTVITLVNPSFKSMKTLDMMSSAGIKSFVYLSSGSRHDMDYNNRVHHFVTNSHWLKMTDQVQGIAYLGSSQPNYYPDREMIPWVRLIPSPFILPCSQFANYSATWDEYGYTCAYERKPGYYVHNNLRFDDGRYLYNPETVDHNFRDKGRPAGLAYLQSSIALNLIECDERRIFHKPRFIHIPKEAHWEEICYHKYRILGRTVYDVQGPGTYVSRRTRVMLPQGYQWAPYVQAGSHWVSLSSLRPRREYDVHVEELKGKTFICFGDTRPVEVTRKLSHQSLWYDEQDAPTKIKASSALPEYDSMLGQKMIRDEYWQDENGGVYPSQIRKEDAVSWRHQLDGVPFLNDNDIETLPRFVGRTGVSFVDVSSLKARGTYYLCSSRQYMVQIIPQATKYFSKNYFHMYTYAPHARSIEEEGEEYQSKLNPEWNNIITDFKAKVVLNVGENARSEQLVSDSLGIPLAVVYRYVRVHPDMFIWKVGVSGSAQWVHRDSVGIRFAGEGTVGGRLWMEVIRESSEQVATTDVTQFRVFCMNNGYNFKYLSIGLKEVRFKVLWIG